MIFLKSKNTGFSLIELTIVLFIITLILGGILTPLSTRLEQGARQRTQTQLDEIRESLIGFAMVNGHFPCPDCTGSTGNCASVTANDGIEDGVESGAGVSPRAGHTFASCAVAEGNLPWTTLDAPEFDAWNNHFTYRVTNEFADDTLCTTSPTIVSFCLDTAGNMQVKNAAGAIIAGSSVNERIPAIVISYGSNGSEVPTSATELENQDTDVLPIIFVSNDYINTDATEFDDMLIWVAPAPLMYQMVRAELLP